MASFVAEPGARMRNNSTERNIVCRVKNSFMTLSRHISVLLGALHSCSEVT
uniref:Uncharacterized protein n=1 Tax=Anguilla anguilla TaxID=7936 RepID=A0A0E9RI72_ANGAN